MIHGRIIDELIKTWSIYECSKLITEEKQTKWDEKQICIAFKIGDVIEGASSKLALSLIGLLLLFNIIIIIIGPHWK